MPPLKSRKPSPAMIVAITALMVALGGSAVAAVKLGYSTPLKVCVAAKEGKPIVTPKGGVCKKGYTLNEVNQSDEVVARIHSVGSVETTEFGPFGQQGPEPADPLSGASWTQGSGEVEQIVGQATIRVPSETECTYGGGPGGSVYLNPYLDGQRYTGISIRSGHAAQTVTVPFGSTGFAEPEQATAHTLEVQVADTCSGALHGTIDSVSIDVIGVH